MKTQINNLTNGNQFTAGTNTEARLAQWAQVVAENPTQMQVELRGLSLNLKANTSLSGKPTSYSTTITKEECMMIYPSGSGFAKRGYIFSIQFGSVSLTSIKSRQTMNKTEKTDFNKSLVIL